MAIASGIFKRLRIKKETTWGTPPSPVTGAHLLLLEGLDTEAEASQLADLLDAGVTVACLKSLPESWPGFPDDRTSALRGKVNKAFESGRARFARRVVAGGH